MSTRKAIGQAVKLYESFRERRPRRIGAARFKVPKAVAVIGYVEGIDYRTTHGKKLTLYHHDFAPGSRPLLAVSSDGKQLLLLGGRYQFTERGIVDKDAKGREIENHAHGQTINPRKRRGNPGKLRQNDVFSQIRALGLTVKRDEAGEIRVTFKGVPAERAEAMAYYTDDLEDALNTATAMQKAALLGS